MCVGYFDSRQNHIYPFDGKLRATLLLVFKPLAERFDLFLGVGREKMFDRLLVTAEEETGKGLRMLLHLTNGGIHTLVGKDWEERSKDFVFHDRIVPGNGVNDGGIDVACLRVGRAASDDFALVDKACETFNRLGTYDARVVVGSVPRIIPVQLDDGFFAPLNEFLGNGFMHISVSG